MQLPQEGLIGLEMKLFLKKRKEKTGYASVIYLSNRPLPPPVALLLLPLQVLGAGTPQGTPGDGQKQFKDLIYSSIQFKANKVLQKQAGNLSLC